MNKQIIDVPTRLEVGTSCPEYKTEGSVGFDLRANFGDGLEPVCQERSMFTSGTVNRIKIYPFGRVLIKTGIRMQIPDGYELQIRPRSGFSLKEGGLVANSPGTIDNDYRGDIGVIITNCSMEDLIINDGDRIAQAVLCPVAIANFKLVKELDDTDRGEGGFGSTGKQ